MRLVNLCLKLIDCSGGAPRILSTECTVTVMDKRVGYHHARDRFVPSLPIIKTKKKLYIQNRNDGSPRFRKLKQLIVSQNNQRKISL